MATGQETMAGEKVARRNRWRLCLERLDKRGDKLHCLNRVSFTMAIYDHFLGQSLLYEPIYNMALMGMKFGDEQRYLRRRTADRY